MIHWVNNAEHTRRRSATSLTEQKLTVLREAYDYEDIEILLVRQAKRIKKYFLSHGPWARFNCPGFYLWL
jgi:hypothetical protein